MLKRLNDFDERSTQSWERWERRFEEASATIKERETIVDGRLLALEEFASTQYSATVVADNWGSHFESRLSDLE